MSNKSIEYLESKRINFVGGHHEYHDIKSNSFKQTIFVTLEHAKTYGKMVDREANIEYAKLLLNVKNIDQKQYDLIVGINESELENLMKS